MAVRTDAEEGKLRGARCVMDAASAGCEGGTHVHAAAKRRSERRDMLREEGQDLSTRRMSPGIRVAH